MTRAEAKWAIANPETLKAMADGDVIEARCLNGLDKWSGWVGSTGTEFEVSHPRAEFRKKPEPTPANESKRWLIWSIKHHAWWGPNLSQYFSDREFAGRYTFDEACECVRRSNQHGQDAPSSAMIEDPDHEPQTKTP